jgi:hypothetical protein
MRANVVSGDRAGRTRRALAHLLGSVCAHETVNRESSISDGASPVAPKAPNHDSSTIVRRRAARDGALVRDEASLISSPAPPRRRHGAHRRRRRRRGRATPRRAAGCTPQYAHAIIGCGDDGCAPGSGRRRVVAPRSSQSSTTTAMMKRTIFIAGQLVGGRCSTTSRTKREPT